MKQEQISLIARIKEAKRMSKMNMKIAKRDWVKGSFGYKQHVQNAKNWKSWANDYKRQLKKF